MFPVSWQWGVLLVVGRFEPNPHAVVLILESMVTYLGGLRNFNSSKVICWCTETVRIIQCVVLMQSALNVLLTSNCGKRERVAIIIARLH